MGDFMDGLSMDNILDESQVEDLFSSDEPNDVPAKQEESNGAGESENIPDNNKGNNKEKEITEADSDDLFSDEPESVGNDTEDNKDKKDTSSKGGSSPTNNFYNSIAKAFREDGVLPDLDEETANNIKSPEDLAEAIENQIQSRLTERQQKIDAALNAGVEPTEIRKYEGALNFLNSVNDDFINDEGDKGINLRKQLIRQDYLNRGFSPEKAEREVKKSFDAGMDIQDAKEALDSNKEYFTKAYDDLVNQAKENERQEAESLKQQGAQLKKSILEDKEVMKDLQLDTPTRNKIYNTLSRPVYKDPETGELLTEIQKYERENRVDFLKFTGLFYTLTNGFKNIDNLVKGKVNKEVRKGLRDLEGKINNTSRNMDGSLNFSGSNDEQSSSHIIFDV